MFGKGRGKDRKKRKRRIGRKLARAANKLNKKVGNAARKVEIAAIKKVHPKRAVMGGAQYKVGRQQMAEGKTREGLKNAAVGAAKASPDIAAIKTAEAADKVRRASRKRKFKAT
jgi:hypothetical protein